MVATPRLTVTLRRRTHGATREYAAQVALDAAQRSACNALTVHAARTAGNNSY